MYINNQKIKPAEWVTKVVILAIHGVILKLGKHPLVKWSSFQSKFLPDVNILSIARRKERPTKTSLADLHCIFISGMRLKKDRRFLATEGEWGKKDLYTTGGIHQWWPYIARKAVNNIRILMLRTKAPFSRSEGLSNDRKHFLETARVPFTYPIGTLYQVNFWHCIFCAQDNSDCQHYRYNAY